MAVTRGEITDSGTDWAQGGLAAVWSTDDAADSHVNDTLVAGAGCATRTPCAISSSMPRTRCAG